MLTWTCPTCMSPFLMALSLWWKYCARAPKGAWLDTQFAPVGKPDKPLTTMFFGPDFLSSKLYHLSPLEVRSHFFFFFIWQSVLHNFVAPSPRALWASSGPTLKYPINWVESYHVKWDVTYSVIMSTYRRHVSVATISTGKREKQRVKNIWFYCKDHFLCPFTEEGIHWWP